MQDTHEIGKRIQIIKSEFGYSNEEIGSICGVSYTAIGNIINGATKDPGVSLFVKLSVKLKIRLEWLLLGEGEMYQADEVNQKVDHPEALKYMRQEIESLRIIIQSKQSEIDTLKKIVTLLEGQDKQSSQRAS